VGGAKAAEDISTAEGAAAAGHFDLSNVFWRRFLTAKRKLPCHRVYLFVYC